MTAAASEKSADRTKTGFSMVMPMAGRGSRFSKENPGTAKPLPKPLIALAGRPFFWWATESVRRAAPLREMVFVVLEEHCREYGIDKEITSFYPQARIVAIPQVTSGAAETAWIGMQALRGTGPVAVNDCDHAFLCPDLAGAAEHLQSDADGALLCFRSANPAYSYARIGAGGNVSGTVEKVVASEHAIAGCYMFAKPGMFLKLYDEYRADCPYNELFVSGMFNRLAARNGRIIKVDAAVHVSFGTPEERDRIDLGLFERQFNWAEP